MSWKESAIHRIREARLIFLKGGGNTVFLVIEIKVVPEWWCCEQELTRKEHKGTFWSVVKLLYLFRMVDR